MRSQPLPTVDPQQLLPHPVIDAALPDFAFATASGPTVTHAPALPRWRIRPQEGNRHPVRRRLPAGMATATGFTGCRGAHLGSHTALDRQQFSVR